ncbi:MAG TPA: ABC transporter permease [Bryobacteraceae bacterium]|nr:ABC transporter permease [Bryobacteraceae bacterium]
MVNRLVFENLKHRPVRTALSAILIGVGVTMILSLVGVSQGVTNDMSARSRGTGADVMVRPPNSSLFNMSGSNMPEKAVAVVRQQPHVTLATGTLVQPVGAMFTSIAGIHLDEFNALSGGFHYSAGGPFTGPHELLVDEVQARTDHLHPGSIVNFGNKWRVTGIVESGKLSRMFAQIEPLQEEYSQTGKISIVWVKVDDPANIADVIAALKARLPDYNIYSMDEMTSLLTANNVPLVKSFTKVVIGISIVVGFLVVFLSMYTAVLERTREIGILKALGASPAYILGMLLRETVLLAILGSVAGILMTYGARELLSAFAPTFPMVIVRNWWPVTAALAIGGSLIGALGPGFKAAKQDAIEALSYD